MKKALFVFLSLIPGFALAEGMIVGSKVRVTAKNPESVLNAISAIQKLSLGLGASKVNLVLDNEKNAVEILVNRVETAEGLAARLRGILGDDVLVERVNLEALKHGTQDDIMKP